MALSGKYIRGMYIIAWLLVAGHCLSAVALARGRPTSATASAAIGSAAAHLPLIDMHAHLYVGDDDAEALLGSLAQKGRLTGSWARKIGAKRDESAPL